MSGTIAPEPKTFSTLTLMENIQFITIPANEWELLKSELKFISTEIMAIKQKSSKEFLTIKEVCLKLKCSRNTLQNYINAGKITGLETKRGVYKKLLFRNADIDYFLLNDNRNMQKNSV